MSEEDKKVIEDLLNINPRNMSYKQLVSMQNGWWETLNLLSEQNKENKQLKEQLQQKENIIKEVREILKYHLSNPSGTKNGWHIDIWNTEDMNKLNDLLEILKGSDK